jgi:Uma2 family endonuclease
MSAVTPSLLTAEQFWNSPLNTKHNELVRGEVRRKSPGGALDGHVSAEIGAQLLKWADRGEHGWTGVGSGFILQRDPDTVRGPDVAFVQQRCIPASGVPISFWNLAPDLAVEVIAFNDMAEDVRESIADYLAAGVRLVWEVHPQRQEVIVHTPDGVARTYHGDDVLEFPDVLPGFSCRAKDCFAAG